MNEFLTVLGWGAMMGGIVAVAHRGGTRQTALRWVAIGAGAAVFIAYVIPAAVATALWALTGGGR